MLLLEKSMVFFRPDLSSIGSPHREVLTGFNRSDAQWNDVLLHGGVDA